MYTSQPSFGILSQDSKDLACSPGSEIGYIFCGEPKWFGHWQRIYRGIFYFRACYVKYLSIEYLRKWELLLVKDKSEFFTFSSRFMYLGEPAFLNIYAHPLHSSLKGSSQGGNKRRSSVSSFFLPPSPFILPPPRCVSSPPRAIPTIIKLFSTLELVSERSKFWFSTLFTPGHRPPSPGLGNARPSRFFPNFFFYFLRYYVKHLAEWKTRILSTKSIQNRAQGSHFFALDEWTHCDKFCFCRRNVSIHDYVSKLGVLG